MGLTSRAGAILASALLARACTNSDGPGQGPVPTSVGTSSTSTSARLSSTPTPTPTPTPTKAAHTCGEKPLAPCPLYAWMKTNTGALWTAGDYAGLVSALQKVATFAPPGYANWASIARDGADAARAEEGEAVKASCRGCHSQYRDRYKRELRERPL